MKKIIVFGNGFIAAHLPYEISKRRLSSNEQEMRETISHYKPDVIINATGFCGKPNVDECESKKSETYMANIVIPLMLAKICEEQNIHMIHLGSGCIFYGLSPHAIDSFHSYSGEGQDRSRTSIITLDSGWKENDIANPVSFYSKTKYACDLAIDSMRTITVLRLRMPISTMNHPRNLLNKLIAYKRVLEEPNSVTFTEDLVNAIDWAVSNEKFGVYNITSPKALTHSVLLEEYKKYVPEHVYEKISKKELENLVIATRSNCILDSSKAVREGFVFRDADTLIRTCVKDFVKNLKEIK